MIGEVGKDDMKEIRAIAVKVVVQEDVMREAVVPVEGLVGPVEEPEGPIEEHLHLIGQEKNHLVAVEHAKVVKEEVEVERGGGRIGGGTGHTKL